MLLIIFSLLVIILAFNSKTTAPLSDTLNIGLLQDQLMLMNFGIGLLICGVLLVGFGGVIARMPNPSYADNANAVDEEYVETDEEKEERHRKLAVGVIASIAAIVLLVILNDQGLV
ncbi:MAG: hypothetical protein WAT93_14905 [Pontixanthobacter sp.]